MGQLHLVMLRTDYPARGSSRRSPRSKSMTPGVKTKGLIARSPLYPPRACTKRWSKHSRVTWQSSEEEKVQMIYRNTLAGSRAPVRGTHRACTQRRWK